MLQFGITNVTHSPDLGPHCNLRVRANACSLLETCRREAFDSIDVHQSICPCSEGGFRAAEALMLLSASLLTAGVSARGYYEVAGLSLGLEFIALMVH